MAAKDLITRARAYQSLQGVSGVDALIDTLVTAASDAVEKYCRRRFLTLAFDELYNGDAQRRLLLRQYPIQSVKSVRYRPVTVAKVINNLPATNQQARVAVTSTGLTLTWVASGVASTDISSTFAGNVTIQALMNAVTAVGHGWSGQIVGDAATQVGQQGDYGLWPSADLYCPNSYGDPLEGAGIQQSQGALSARGAFAELKMHTYELQGYQWDARGWLLRAIPYTDPELLHPEDLIFPVGINNFRVQYTAGYSTVPESVQQATAEWVAQMYFEALRDPALQHQLLAGGAASGWADLAGKNGQVPDRIRTLLQPFRRITAATNQS